VLEIPGGGAGPRPRRPPVHELPDRARPALGPARTPRPVGAGGRSAPLWAFPRTTRRSLGSRSASTRSAPWVVGR
jgi:hypothetical protein